MNKAQMTKPTHLIAFGFGTGLSPVAPGTVGSLVGFPAYWLLSGFSLEIYCLITFACFIVGVYICDVVSKDLGVHDFGGIVWDEVVGMLITMIALPQGWIWWLVAFAAFRFFDILKPWPIGWLDKKVSGGFGIMIDDVLAGFYALAVVQGTYWITNHYL